MEKTIKENMRETTLLLS